MEIIFLTSIYFNIQFTVNYIYHDVCHPQQWIFSGWWGMHSKMYVNKTCGMIAFPHTNLEISSYDLNVHHNLINVSYS